MALDDDKKERQTVKPRGEAIDWTDEELARISRITPQVIADAKADLRRRDPELARELESVER